MHYFKTTLTPEQISKVLHHYYTDPDMNFCVVEIQHKKALVISNEEGEALSLMNDDNFKPINLTELDLITIPVMYQVVSVTGNTELFNHYINPHV